MHCETLLLPTHLVAYQSVPVTPWRCRSEIATSAIGSARSPPKHRARIMLQHFCRSNVYFDSGTAALVLCCNVLPVPLVLEVQCAVRSPNSTISSKPTDLIATLSTSCIFSSSVLGVILQTSTGRCPNGAWTPWALRASLDPMGTPMAHIKWIFSMYNVMRSFCWIAFTTAAITHWKLVEGGICFGTV